MSDSDTPRSAATRSFKRTVVELTIVAVLGATVGVAFEVGRPRPQMREGQPLESPAAAAPAQPSTLFDLSPIVTNLGSPQDTWVRLEGSIIFDPKALPHPEAVAGQIGDDVLAYLRTVSLRQLEGPIGLQNIREDLNERAATRSGGKVREFVIRTLVMQ